MSRGGRSVRRILAMLLVMLVCWSFLPVGASALTAGSGGQARMSRFRIALVAHSVDKTLEFVVADDRAIKESGSEDPGYPYTGNILWNDASGGGATGSLRISKTVVRGRCLTVNKVWKNDSADTRPESIFVQLWCEGEQHGDPVELKASDGWTYTWDGLDADALYHVQELDVPGYTSSVSASEDESVVTITNSGAEMPLPPPPPPPSPFDPPDVYYQVIGYYITRLNDGTISYDGVAVQLEAVTKGKIGDVYTAYFEDSTYSPFSYEEYEGNLYSFMPGYTSDSSEGYLDSVHEVRLTKDNTEDNPATLVLWYDRFEGGEQHPSGPSSINAHGAADAFPFRSLVRTVSSGAPARAADGKFEFKVFLSDAGGSALSGEFVYDGSHTGMVSNGGTVLLGDGESIEIQGLPAGTRYRVVESENADFESTNTGGEGVVFAEETALAVFVNREKNDIEDDAPGFELPKTGGSGPDVFYAAGTVLALLAAVLPVLRRRSGGGR